MNNESHKSSFHIKLLYITTVGLILSNVLTLILAYTMVTSVKDSIYGVQPLRSQARAPLQYDPYYSEPTGGGGGTIGTPACPFNSKPPNLTISNFTCEGGSRDACRSKCSDVYLTCIGKYCYAYPQGSDSAYSCLTNWAEFYASCTSLCDQVCAVPNQPPRPRVE